MARKPKAMVSASAWGVILESKGGKSLALCFASCSRPACFDWIDQVQVGQTRKERLQNARREGLRVRRVKIQWGL